MQIDHNILVTYGGVSKKFEKNAFIFHEDSMPYCYYQIMSGEVRLYTTNAEGKELTQGIFKQGQSFGEPPLLLGKSYPATAQTCTDCVITKLGKEHFLNVLHDFPDLSEKLLYTFANRIYSKATSAQIWVRRTPEEKILRFLKIFKQKTPTSTNQAIPYTRQQIADFTGLRVETVIRTLIKMQTSGTIKIINHKLFY